MIKSKYNAIEINVILTYLPDKDCKDAENRNVVK